MDKKDYKKGQYAEIMAEYAEHIFGDSVVKTERNYHYIAPEGTRREVDVCANLKDGRKIAFEVRDRKSTQSIDWIDQIVGKYATAPFDEVWVCTFDGCELSKEAIKKLDYHKIGWRDFTMLSESNSDNRPVVMVEGIKICREDIEIFVDEKKFRKLCIKMNTEEEMFELGDALLKDLKGKIKENFELFKKENVAIFEQKFDLRLSENNFDKEFIDVRAEIPLQHVVFVDYLDETYSVVNNGSESTLVTSKNKSVFVADDALVVDFGYLGRISVDTILSPNMIIVTENIPSKYKNAIKELKIIDVSGEHRYSPTSIYGMY